ncbi:hypothetical protein COU96_00865 [Candidatus Shapirobacteria bacterium CG10_big_fil_rev_8_21_14_0_10_38_14]|uniref:Glycosyltransferase RgtA/B/C/D-like domain-containing protein n=1 Tax=Candidatus Shapirobacteria bacterium CG10_big_fil_rev_8_21_14_0_10_38_14 TaxID=1974483 RepID=A0A2M8L619_9BACT|nr:MAG: hypothetical protein COU96_00865 [Candidatus Shapirobacteria bacterium CG10_big_fil_rev_8_21_14_0_10_38_14]
MKLPKINKKNWLEIIFLGILFVFSWWLMWHTFNYKDGVIYIATKAWSDFAAHLPLIRSFSWGKNFPPEYPLFPGEPIRYHFLFYFLVGMLEKIGLPLDWALNLPSVFGFWSLLVIIYLLAKLFFNKKSVAFLAVLFFLFNGSLSFLEFFKQHPLSFNTPKEIITNNTFPSFGPYDGKIVSAFWNLNIFTNQRHLGASYFLVLSIIYLLLKAVKLNKKLKPWQILLMGFIFGIMPFFHKAAFLITGPILLSLFLYLPKLRRPIFIIGLIATFLALPQLTYQFRGEIPLISFHPGYLIAYPLTVKKFFFYWFQNLGVSLILIPAGFLLSNKLAKKLFLAVLPLFFIGNLFQFSPEIAANHKFFNLFLIIGNMFSAWVIYKVWQKKFFGKLIAFLLIFFLVFSGIIDFFPIKNDSLGAINDAPKNPDILWIKENTPPDSIFLNSSYLYHPASLAGRKIFLGWPYFSWSAGYNTNKKDQLAKQIWTNDNKKEVCFLLRKNNIYGVILEEKSPDFPINVLFWKNNFYPSYRRKDNSLIIYEIHKNCQG